MALRAGKVSVSFGKRAPGFLNFLIRAPPQIWVYYNDIRAYCPLLNDIIINSIFMKKTDTIVPLSQTASELQYQFKFSYRISCTNWDLLTNCTSQAVDEGLLLLHFVHQSRTLPKPFSFRLVNIGKCYCMMSSFGSLVQRWIRPQIEKITGETADIVSWLVAWGKSCFINKRDSWCW